MLFLKKIFAKKSSVKKDKKISEVVLVMKSESDLDFVNDFLSKVSVCDVENLDMTLLGSKKDESSLCRAAKDISLLSAMSGVYCFPKIKICQRYPTNKQEAIFMAEANQHSEVFMDEKFDAKNQQI